MPTKNPSPPSTALLRSIRDNLQQYLCSPAALSFESGRYLQVIIDRLQVTPNQDKQSALLADIVWLLSRWATDMLSIAELLNTDSSQAPSAQAQASTIAPPLHLTEFFRKTLLHQATAIRGALASGRTAVCGSNGSGTLYIGAALWRLMSLMDNLLESEMLKTPFSADMSHASLLYELLHDRASRRGNGLLLNLHYTACYPSTLHHDASARIDDIRNGAVKSLIAAIEIAQKLDRKASLEFQGDGSPSVSSAPLTLNS